MPQPQSDSFISLKPEPGKLWMPPQAAPCACGVAGCASCAVTQRLATLNARVVVLAAGKEGPRSLLLLKIAGAVIADIEHFRYLQAGASSLFIQQTLGCGKDQTKNTERPLWEYPVVGILASLIANSPKIRNVPGITAEMQMSYHSIIDVIWKDLDLLTGGGIIADEMRCIVAQLICSFALDDSMKRNMYDRRTLMIALCCWLYTPLGSSYRKITGQAVDELFSFHSGNAHPWIPSNCLQIALHAFGLPSFIFKVNCILKHHNLLGQDLEREIYYLMHFVGSFNGKEFTQNFIEGQIHEHLCTALNRQVKDKVASKDKSVTHQILERGGLILCVMMRLATSSQSMEMLTYLLKMPEFMEVATAALLVCLEIHVEKRTMWSEILENIAHAINCKDPKCHFHTTAAFDVAVRAAVTPHAIPTLVALQRLTEDQGSPTKYNCLWNRLVMDMDMGQNCIRDLGFRVNKMCCNFECPTRSAHARPQKIWTCARCHSVFYCDIACQKSDWPVHKRECKTFRQELVA